MFFVSQSPRSRTRRIEEGIGFAERASPIRHRSLSSAEVSTPAKGGIWMRKHQNPDSPFNWIVIVRLLAALIELVRQLSDQFPMI